MPDAAELAAAVSDKAQVADGSIDAINQIESAKRKAAFKAVEDYYDPSFRYVGIGSGSTIQYVIDAIKERIDPSQASATLFIPTGFQSRTEIQKRGLISIPYDSLTEDQELDIAFDGADEVDEEMNCIKGGGACLFQEKLVAMKAKKFVCVADYRKDVSRLLTNWSYIPIEVAPIAVNPVIKSLRLLGCPDPSLRMLEVVKSGPLKTDQDFYIIQAPFPPLLTSHDLTDEHDHQAATAKASGATWGTTVKGQKGRVWEVATLAAAIKSITGVLEVGLFFGATGTQAKLVDTSVLDPNAVIRSQGGQKPVAAYFGMNDGSVKVRKVPAEQ